MKKLLLLCLLASRPLLFSQTILNSLPLDFQARTEKGQVLSIKDAKSDDIYVFASDNKDLSILKYNKSLFLKSQFKDSIKTAANRVLLGYSLGEDKNPILYWFSSTFRNVQLIKYNLTSQTSKSLYFNFPENLGYVITTFQKDNVFYVLGKEDKEQHLLLYKFENGTCEIKMLDFSSFLFQNASGRSFTFNYMLRNFVKKMEKYTFNPIDNAASPNKIYIEDDHIILTFDYNLKKTQVFDINIETLLIKEKFFNQPVPKNAAQSANSFYTDKQLFQIVANKDELLLDVKDFDSGASLKSFAYSKNDSIPKTSPFLVQTSISKPQKLKTTSKFLRNLSGLNTGVSVLKNKETSFITIGGLGEYAEYDFYGNPADFDNFYEPTSYLLSKVVYFDAALDKNLDFVKDKNIEPMAIDNLFYFLSLNKNIVWYDALKLDDFQVLFYYDPALKQLVIRKFTDGFINENMGNPIMNKSIFSKPFSFGNIKSN
ncbi:hypothetical protein [Flavobacterium foetidum]|uniref:hypothetical protein n=1 Tax=Flavobacterium foetidum TaxID=2026681 RepID=UPI001075829F|nr:hypothetical protein [Flavobacterium foetidum]KAF2507447.1 hypothetical protein E0W73_20270 [Flavobacterium foetidum]